MSGQDVHRKIIRKPGAQPGNLNAFKHGMYSKIFQPLERDDIKKLLSISLDEQIIMLQNAAQHLFDLSHQVEDTDQAIKVLGALGLAAIRTSRLLKAEKESGNVDHAEAIVNKVITEILKDWGRI